MVLTAHSSTYASLHAVVMRYRSEFGYIPVLRSMGADSAQWQADLRATAQGSLRETELAKLLAATEEARKQLRRIPAGAANWSDTALGRSGLEKELAALIALWRRGILPLLAEHSPAIHRLLALSRRSRSEFIDFLMSHYPLILMVVESGLGLTVEAAESLMVGVFHFEENASGLLGRARRERVIASLGRPEDDFASIEQAQSSCLRDSQQVVKAAHCLLETEIARGASSREEAEALYWLGFVEYAEQSTTYPGLSALRTALAAGHFSAKVCPAAGEPVKLAVKRFNQHLRSNPTDMQALQLLLSYRILGRSHEVYETEIRLMKAQQGTNVPLAPESAVTDPSGLSFEVQCQRLLSAMGYVATLTKASGDGGIDIFATRSDPMASGKYIVQCKDWQGNVGEKEVRDLYGVVCSEDANKGILIARSGFTASALSFAAGKRLELIDGEQLARLVATYLGRGTQARRAD